MKNIEEVFAKYNMPITKTQKNQFEQYFSMLITANKEFNLTAITEEQDVLIKHFLDSVLPEKLIPENAKIVDIGSGAGFPALPLKILRPDLDVYMVDSLNKRVVFLQNVINDLNLQKASAFHSRAEDFAKEHREMFDVAVARAVAPLNTLVEYLLPFVKIGGAAIIYKSSKLDEEIAVAQNAIKILGAKIEKIADFHIEEQDLNRKVLVLRKINATPMKYPRGKNNPKLNPIK